MRNILIALSGVSPAVVTETVWALALQSPSIVPDEVVVLTTKTGKARLMAALQFVDGIPDEKGPWGALKKALAAKKIDVKNRLVLTEQTIKVFVGADQQPLDDLRTRQENLLAANLMMKEIRDFTDDDDCVVHAQLAGGRKTMSALFFSCMCLLARPCDHVYHVLVSEGYDQKLTPPFFFPQKGVTHTATNRDGTIEKFASLKAKIELFDVPFISMGEWAEQKCKKNKRRPLSYESLIEAVNAGVRDDVYPEITIDLSGRGDVQINGRSIKLSHFEFALFMLMLQGRCAADCLAPLCELKDFLCIGDGEDLDGAIFDDHIWLEHFMGDETKQANRGKFAWYGLTDEMRKTKKAHDLSNTLSTLRGKVPQMASLERLLSFDHFPANFDVSKVVWLGHEGLPAELVELLFLPATRQRLFLENEK